VLRRRRRMRAQRREMARGPGAVDVGEKQRSDVPASVQSMISKGQVEHRLALLRDIKAGGQLRAAALKSLRGNVRKYSFESTGCRVVQAAFELGSSSEAQRLVEELHGHVREAIASPHANFVISAAVAALPAEQCAFIAEVLHGYAAATARHRFGCRVLCRLVEHALLHPATTHLLEEILQDALGLSRHKFGHHVITSILEHGLVGQQRRIAEALVHDFPRNARNRHFRFALEGLMKFGHVDDRTAIIHWMMTSPELLVELAVHQYGYSVVSAVVTQDLLEVGTIIARLSRAEAQLVASKFGQRILQDLKQSQPGGYARAAPAA